jgi:hypothetical protein
MKAGWKAADGRAAVAFMRGLLRRGAVDGRTVAAAPRDTLTEPHRKITFA